MRIRLRGGPANGLVVNYADHVALELIRRGLAEPERAEVPLAPVVEVSEVAIVAEPEHAERAVRPEPLRIHPKRRRR
jgi:hypothetical protein